MKPEVLIKFVKEKNWIGLSTSFTPNQVTEVLDYQECMNLGYDLFFENLHDDKIQDFAVRLFFSIRQKFPLEWNLDWKNDAFLGELCGLTWRYDERYECHKRAYDKLKDPPDSLLLLLSGCNSAPGTPPISDEESEEYLKRAINKKLTFEAAITMLWLSRHKYKNVKDEEYWDAICKELEAKNIHTEVIIPDVFKDKEAQRSNRGEKP